MRSGTRWCVAPVVDVLTNDVVADSRSHVDVAARSAPDSSCRWPLRAVTIPRNLAAQGIHASTGARILDLGCGSGMVGFALTLATDAATVVSVDRADVLSVAERLAAILDVHGRVSFVSGDVESIQLPPGSFDVAVRDSLREGG